MNKEEIEKRYSEMVLTIESANIYDGRGEYDLYECDKCRNYKITLYTVKGVTPFMIRCECGGFMQHTKSYRSVPDYIRVFRWKRPTLEETMILSEGLIEHVLKGGLVLDIDINAARENSKLFKTK